MMRLPRVLRDRARGAAGLLQAGDLALALAVLAYLLPLWWFPYLPTQDGPAHLSNALILKDYGRDGNRFQEFYWINWSPIPNLTCFLLLAGLAHLVPALLAEKLLVSGYLVAFALSYRYFLASVGGRSSWVAAAALLLAFNRCFWLGFYNYCLSLVLVFVILGFFLKRWPSLRPRDAAALVALFGIAYFTHIFGFLLAAMGCVWVATTMTAWRWGRLLVLGAVLAVPAGLTVIFFAQAGFFTGAGFGRLLGHLQGWLSLSVLWSRLSADSQRIGFELFGIGARDSALMPTVLLALYGVLLVAAPAVRGSGAKANWARVRALIGLGALMALLFFLLPNVLTPGMGGFWKTRLVLLPPLFWLACVQESSSRAVRGVLRGAIVLGLGVNLAVVIAYMSYNNELLVEFRDGLATVGRDRVIFFQIHHRPQDAVNPLLHCGDLYCLESRNINVGPHFATRDHSLVRFLPGIKEAKGIGFQDYENRSRVDAIVLWDSFMVTTPAGFRAAYQGPLLTVFVKRE